MVSRKLLIALTNLVTANAFRLLVASYKPENSNTTGAIQTLEFGRKNASFSITHTSQNCGSLPSWLDISSCGRIVTCVDEGTPGSLTMLTVKSNGSLRVSSTTSTLGGPVSDSYFNNGSAVALAHYEPPAISTFAVGSNNTFRPLQNFTFNSTDLSSDQQNTSHIHQALLDPTNQYLVFPDLGLDLVRVYRIEPQTGMLAEHAPIKSKTGYGPRHAVFWSPKDAPSETFLFVLHELSNKIVSYSVTYLEKGGLTFTEVDEVSTYGRYETPQGAAAAEITKTPDNNFLIASNRLGPIFNVTNPDPHNSTMIKSDSLVTFRPMKSGKLDLVGLTPSGGLHPRHFSLNKDGSRIAVANQVSRNVVVWSRDTKSGKIGKRIAAAFNLGPGELTNVQWLRE